MPLKRRKTTDPKSTEKTLSNFVGVSEPVERQPESVAAKGNRDFNANWLRDPLFKEWLVVNSEYTLLSCKNPKP
jgi:hypothetical protein